MKGLIMDKKIRFTEIDYDKLVNDFVSVKNGEYWSIKNTKGKSVAKMYIDQELLVITKDQELLNWLLNNSYLRNSEIAK
jgi:hypothetical protein